jgi:hypothetical protein
VLLYCVSFWFWREIGSFFVVAGNFCYDWKKKRYSRLSGGCAIIIMSGKKGQFYPMVFFGIGNVTAPFDALSECLPGQW